MRNFQAILRFINDKGLELVNFDEGFRDMAHVEQTLQSIRTQYPSAVRVIVDIALNP